MDFYLFFFLFVFHKEFLVISHNFNDQVCTIIIAQPNLDNQIGAIERVDINPQPLIGMGTGLDWVGIGTKGIGD